MTLIEYLNTKYPSGNFGLMSAEAKVFRIKYPLQTGWLQKHQNDAITPLQIRELKNLLQKKDKEINKRTLEFLEREFKDNHIELVKSTISATFPKVSRNIGQCEADSYQDSKTYDIGTPVYWNRPIDWDSPPVSWDKPDKFTAQISAFKQLKEKRKC